jgi:hypothetical protein
MTWAVGSCAQGTTARVAKSGFRKMSVSDCTAEIVPITSGKSPVMVW